MAKRPSANPANSSHSTAQSNTSGSTPVTSRRIRLHPTDASVAHSRVADRDAAKLLRRPGAIYARFPEFATTSRGQSTFTHAYLTDNRLDWWALALNGSVPASGAIARDPNAVGETAMSAFQRQFFSTLATVVGGRLRDIAIELQFDGFNNVLPRARQIPWDTVPAPASVNTIEGTECYAAATAIGAPGLAETEIIGSLGRASTVALVNPVVVDGANSITALTIHFMLPQRAVGLECGYLGEAGFFGPDSFSLVARDAEGQLIAISPGSALDLNNWLPSQVHFIGVADERGGIASVELRCTDVGFSPTQRLFVTRIWYECLPPAVMLQGTLCNVEPVDFISAQHASHPDALAFAAENPTYRNRTWGPIRKSPIQIELPYRCDKAVVLMRGFKLAHTDASATNVQKLTAHLTSWLNGTTLSISFHGELARGAPDSWFNTGVIGEHPDGPRSDPTLGGGYYTVIAWESARIALHSSPSEPNEAHTGNQATHTFDLPNRHPESQGVVGVAEERIGPLLGTVRGVRWVFDSGQEIQGLAFIPGSRGGSDGGGHVEWDQSGVGLEDVALATIFLAAGQTWLWGVTRAGRFESADQVLLRVPPLLYTDFGRKIRWSFGTDLRDTASDDVGVRAGMSGFVLNGASLDVTYDPTSIGFDTNGPHAAARRLEAAPFNGEGGAEISGGDASVDMPIVGLGPFLFMPEDDLHELDVEVRAESFDGRLLLMRFGGGVDLMPSTDDARFVMGMPVVGWLRRTTTQPIHRVSVRNVLFRTPRGVLMLAPVEHGALRNDGNVSLLIDAMQITGIARANYNLKIDYRGTEIAIGDVTARGPLLLEPGESIVVGGAFYARPLPPRKQPSNSSGNAARPGRRDLGRHPAVLRCRTNHRGYGIVDIVVSADIVPSNAAAQVEPQQINFGLFDLLHVARQQQPRSRPLLVASVGTTPLFISAITVEPPSPAFVYRIADAPPAGSAAPGAILQLDPGTSLVLLVFFNPTMAGVQETTLAIETNVGRFAVPLRGEGVPF